MPSKLARSVRTTPWLLLAQAAVVLKDHWTQLEPRDRERLRALLAKSRGRPQNLTAREREAIKRIVGRLDLGGAVRELAPLGRRARSRKRR